MVIRAGTAKTGLEWPLAAFLLVNPFITLIRAGRGPTAADRMLAALLFGTTGLGILLLAHAGVGVPRLKWPLILITHIAGLIAPSDDPLTARSP